MGTNRRLRLQSVISHSLVALVTTSVFIFSFCQIAFADSSRDGSAVWTGTTSQLYLNRVLQANRARAQMNGILPQSQYNSGNLQIAPYNFNYNSDLSKYFLLRQMMESKNYPLANVIRFFASNQMTPYFYFISDNLTLFEIFSIYDPSGAASRFLIQSGFQPAAINQAGKSGFLLLAQSDYPIHVNVWRMLAEYYNFTPRHFMVKSKDPQVQLHGLRLASNKSLNNLMTVSLEAGHTQFLKYIIEELGVLGFLDEDQFIFNPNASPSPESITTSRVHSKYGESDLFLKILKTKDLDLILFYLQHHPNLSNFWVYRTYGQKIVPLHPIIYLIHENFATNYIEIVYRFFKNHYERVYANNPTSKELKMLAREIENAAKWLAKKHGDGSCLSLLNRQIRKTSF